ncbi:MAG: PH domain-containing protein [Firmicutes bacterium]|nr:PH domain-containing protein [Bacillota bacterium]
MEKNIREGKISVAVLIIRLIIDFFAMIIFIGFVWIVRDIIKFFTTKLIITNKRVVGRTGLINTNELDSPLNKINGVQVKQGLFGKIFNYGTISITTASTIFHFDMISEPNEFKMILNNQIEIYDDERIEKQARKMAEAMR